MNNKEQFVQQIVEEYTLPTLQKGLQVLVDQFKSHLNEEGMPALLSFYDALTAEGVMAAKEYYLATFEEHELKQLAEFTQSPLGCKWRDEGIDFNTPARVQAMLRAVVARDDMQDNPVAEMVKDFF